MKISVVMPSFNQARFVEAALLSVLNQGHSGTEIIFVDGGSTDGTMDVVERYRDRLACCVSEPDKGQSDALKKGFDRATGDVVTWLNTDDLLLPGALREVASQFTNRRRCDALFGNTIWIDAEDRIVKCSKSGDHFPHALGLRLGLLSAGGPSAFFARDLYQAVGGINRDLHYMMDTELWWRFAMHGASLRRSNRYIWALRLHADAKVSGHLYADKDDPKQKKVAMARAKEARHVSDITKGYVWPVAQPVRDAVRYSRRIASPEFLAGRLHDRAWRGKNLDAALEALCPAR